MKLFIQKLCKLIDVKSLITLYLTGIFGYLAVSDKVGVEQFLTVFTVIISFYFGVQYEKNNNDNQNK